MEMIQEGPEADAEDRVVVPVLRKSIRAARELVIVRPGEHQFAKRGPHRGLSNTSDGICSGSGLYPATFRFPSKCMPFRKLTFVCIHRS